MSGMAFCSLLFSFSVGYNDVCAQRETLDPVSPHKQPLSPDYNIRWNTHGRNSADSMPVGGGNVQLNVWSENKEILFYVGSTDSFIDNGATLGKLGRVRLHFSPDPFQNSFYQELNLKESEIIIRGDNGFEIKIWVDVFQPVVHVEMNSTTPVEVSSHYETWKLGAEYSQDDGVVFHYRNPEKSLELERLIATQKAESFRDKVKNPISNRTFGGFMYSRQLIKGTEGKGEYRGVPYKSFQLKSKEPMRKMDLRVALRVAQDLTLEDWKDKTKALAQKTDTSQELDKKKSCEWWNEFWNRSYIYINPEEDPSSSSTADVSTNEKAAAWQVGRNYQLFRYMLACSKGAQFPVQFNGGIFNFENGEGSVPEKRMWQECEFMAQNQRLIYWPLLKSGDEDIMTPYVRFYKDMADLQYARAKNYWNIEGTAYPEALGIFGFHTEFVYGNPEMVDSRHHGLGQRKREKPGHSGLGHLEYHYTSTLDAAYMLLEQCRFGKARLKDNLPVIEGAVKFYDHYYKKKSKELTGQELGKDGKLILYPACSLEHCSGAKNPPDVVSGLHALVNGVLSFPEGSIPKEKVDYFRGLQSRLPEIVLKEEKGKTIIAQAESWEGETPLNLSNMEFPEMYTLFPFEYYTFENPSGLQIARDTWLMETPRMPKQKQYICWFQGGIDAAHLGLTDEAKRFTLNKFLHPNGPDGTKKAPLRFPAFWCCKGFDQHPDIDHGGCAMIGLQDMLMQTPGQKIYLFPAWPTEWECEFKLHAPYGTTVQGKVKQGQLMDLIVTPSSREKDVVNMLKKKQ